MQHKCPMCGSLSNLRCIPLGALPQFLISLGTEWNSSVDVLAWTTQGEIAQLRVELPSPSGQNDLNAYYNKLIRRRVQRTSSSGQAKKLRRSKKPSRGRRNARASKA